MTGAIQKQYQALMDKPVSRTEFLKIMGLMVMSVVGVTAFLKNLGAGLNSGHSNSNKISSGGSGGYGGGSYGR